MEESEDDWSYEVNFYYGIHYPVEEIDAVVKVLEGTKFADLASEEREFTSDGKLFLRNVNSDGDATRGIIFSDDMSVQGAEADVPTTFCKFDPTALSEMEEQHKECVEIITDIYDIIIAGYKRTGRSIRNMYLGWCVYNCEWCNESSESEESPRAKVSQGKSTQGKNVQKQQGKNVQGKSAQGKGKK